MHDHPYAAVADELSGTAFGTIVYAERTGSTNHDAADVLGDPRFAGRTFVAEYQTLGSGRKGRTWQARAGTALLFTTILPEALPARNLWTVPFWAALAVRGALASHGIAAALHWPNDLLIGKRKVSGILCTSRIAGDEAWVACGIGINVYRQPGADHGIEPPPAFCSDVAHVGRAELLHAVLLEFDKNLATLDDPARVVAAWETAAGLPGRRYRILKDGTAIPFEATALRLADGGGLVVDRDDRSRETIDLADARALR